MVLTLVVIFQSMGAPSTSSVASDATSTTAGLAITSEPASPAGTSGSTAVATPSVPVSEAPVAAAPSSAAADQPAPPSAAPGAVPDLTIKDATGHPAASITAGALPAGEVFVAAGKGSWHVVPGTTPALGSGAQRSTFTVEVEDGLQSAEADKAFAAEVDAVLADPRSWIGGGQFTLQRIDRGDPDFRISLTSQLTVRSGCGFDIPLEASCFNGGAGRVLINDARWIRGAMSYQGDLTAYRSYALNHEVGHALGMRHERCPATGAPAPVMMQQSWSVSNNDLSVLDPQNIPRDGKVCAPNPYPYPGAVSAPAAATDGSTAAG